MHTEHKPSASRAGIMCTLTARQILEQPRLVEAMYGAGMRSVRINTAHLTGIDQLESLASRLKGMLPDIKLLIDTKGPEMRTTSLAGPELTLRPGQEVSIEGDGADTPTTASCIHLNYPDVHHEMEAGHRLLIDDGTIEMEVMKVHGRRITARVITGGVLGSRKGVSVAGVDLNLPAVSQHDHEYIGYAAQSALIDVVAHSFVRSASDVHAVKAAMGDMRKPVIAKIESQQGIDNLQGIIAAADGVLIARGDLTASIGREAVPAVQALISRATNEAKLPLYLATNILPSLLEDTEVSADDVDGIHTAVAQGVDVLLLTNETASGRNPQLSVQTLARAIGQ